MTTTDKSNTADKAVKAPTQKELKAKMAELIAQKEAQLEAKDRKGAKKTRRQIRKIRALLPVKAEKPATEKKARKANKAVEVPAAEVITETAA